MNEIRIVDGSYAVMRSERVIGVVERSSGGRWRWRAVVEGVGQSFDYVDLSFALQQGLKFNPSP